MELWYPQAKQDKFTDAGSFVARPYRGLLHTTEGSTYAGARSAYAASGNMPHFTIGAEGCWQHCQLDHASRALVNAPGGVETNRLSCIQIEVIGFAAKPAWPDSLITAVKNLMIWIEQQTGIKPWSPPFEAYPASYGFLNSVRMTADNWVKFDGWCGHQHCPENDHGDPGAIPIQQLLERPVADNVPTINYKPTAIVARPQGDGYWIVAYDGGVFNFGNAPALTAIGGDPVERIISASAWPDGNGLLCLGEDGGVFGLGSAQYKGRVLFKG